MRCPKCYFPNTRVYDTRVTQNDRTEKRRRECEKCYYRFTTLEEIKILDLKVEKRNGQVVDFNQEKLEYGIRKAFNKRPVDNKLVTDLILKITEDAIATGKNPVKTTRVGRVVLKRLREVDEAAYICFASMFWNFESLTDFNKLLNKFQQEHP